MCLPNPIAQFAYVGWLDSPTNWHLARVGVGLSTQLPLVSFSTTPPLHMLFQIWLTKKSLRCCPPFKQSLLNKGGPPTTLVKIQPKKQ